MIEELIKKAKKGDNKAFEKLILYYHLDLFRIARTRLNQIDDICDAVQETILYAYKSIHNLKNISKFKTWLIKILINKCNDIYIVHKKSNSISYETIDIEKSIYQSAELNSNLEFDNLLNVLNNEEKTIIILYYAEGYNTNEISKILKLNTNTVRSKLLRAKKKLEKDLKEVYKYE